MNIDKTLDNEVIEILNNLEQEIFNEEPSSELSYRLLSAELEIPYILVPLQVIQNLHERIDTWLFYKELLSNVKTQCNLRKSLCQAIRIEAETILSNIETLGLTNLMKVLVKIFQFN